MSLCPNCTYQELPNKVKNSPVKGYAKVSECSSCRTARENDALKENDIKEQDKVNQLISAKVREQAIDSLKAEGKIEEVSGKLILK